jgi:arginyl-tRNA synthetase
LEEAFKFLDDKGLIYQGTLPPPKGKEMEDWEPAELTLFRSSQFGDNTDRPLKKRDGSWAYAMPDIAYHLDKIRRGFTLMINVWGTDHMSYQDRIKPAVTVFSEGKAKLDIIFNNMVKVFKNGEPVKLSKRSGNIITLREMVEQVGAGAVRFIMLTRDPKSPLDFDFAKVIEQSRDNPVFYVQYAHARICSVLRHAREVFGAPKNPTAEDRTIFNDQALIMSDTSLLGADLSLLESIAEIAMIRKLSEWPRIVAAAAQAHEPHRIAFYLQDVAAELHALWTSGKDNAELRFILPDQPEKTAARLALLRAVALVIAAGLGIIGVEPAEQM